MAGLIWSISEFFGWEVEKRVRRMIADGYHGELPVGQAEAVKTGHEHIPYLICAPTMPIPMDIANTHNAYLAFRAVLDLVPKVNVIGMPPIRSILCPGLGTGIGRMPVARCARQMRAAYGDVLTASAEHYNLQEAVEYYNLVYLK
jgi:O-acetyl-ADP-ribose deacetylase (regulator of RNase III)